MDFFKKIAEIGLANVDIKIVVKEDILSVLIDPKSMAKDKSLKLIQPATISGTAAEIDEIFFDTITEPLKKTAGIITNIEEHEKSAEAAKKAKEDEKKASADKKSKTSDSGSGVVSKSGEKDTTANKPAKDPKPKAEKPPKPEPPYQFQKYEDAVRSIVEVPGFKIKSSNISELKDKVNYLLVMDKNNKLGIEWEKKIKDWKPSIFDDDEDEIAEQIISENTTEDREESQPPVAPPPPPMDEESEENPFDDDGPDTDFENFMDEGGTGHGDISHSDADQGL